MRDLQKDPLRLGILGAGSFIERRILPALQGLTTIKAVCLQKRDLEAAKALAKRFNVPHAVSTRSELLQDPSVEAVYIATPHHMHEEDALAVAKAGKPCLCEKPLGLSVSSIEKMLAVFQGIPFMVGHSLRFKPAVQEAKRLLQSGALGALKHMHLYFSLPLPKESWRHRKDHGGGVLYDIGVHLIDLIHFITEQKIIDVASMSDLKEVDETASVLCKLQSGQTVFFHCSFEEPLRSGFELIGSIGSIISRSSLRQSDDGSEELIILGEKRPVDNRNIYAEELMHFAAVVNGESESIIAAEIALATTMVVRSVF
jgi:predicted dehydrogenase